MNVLAAAAPKIRNVRNEGRHFYLWMAVGYLMVAFGGFIPTYWARVATGTFTAPAILHVHGLLLFSWVCFYLLQTGFVTAGRVAKRWWAKWPWSRLRNHRVLGMPRVDSQRSRSAQCRSKRWMVLLMSAMMTPAIARVFLTFLAPPGTASGPPPAFVSIPPAFVADLFIVVAIVRDLRTLGKPHPIYVYGGLIVLAQQTLTPLIAATSGWMLVATAFERLAG